jgi:hypothetical protein
MEADSGERVIFVCCKFDLAGMEGVEMERSSRWILLRRTYWWEWRGNENERESGAEQQYQTYTYIHIYATPVIVSERESESEANDLHSPRAPKRAWHLVILTQS